jgi:hypothetical protein
MYKMQSIEPFIEAGYYTVPLNGKSIARNEQGKKHGYSFPQDWQKRCSQTANETHTSLGGILTGELGETNIVAIDCDDTETYELFRGLDPENTAVFESIGKIKLEKDGTQTDLKSCTILYKAIPDLPTSKRLKGSMDLDWYNGTGMLFLPTEANTTKETWWTDDSNTLYNHNGDPVTIRPMPPLVAQVLKVVLAKDAPDQTKTVADTQHSRRTKGFLGKLLSNYDFKELIADQEYVPELTKILTPKEYRDAKYLKQGHIHPNDVGVRHDYLFKIMCILAGDNTVDSDLARDVIMWINCLLDPPRSTKQMESEIIGGIVSGRQLNPQGEPYWQYDENWDSIRSWTSITKTGGDLVDIFYDQFNKDYFVYNTYTDHMMIFGARQQLMEHISATSIDQFNQKEVIQDMNNVETLVEPTEDFGYIEDDRQFNLFKPTQALRILSDPTLHEDLYKEPTEFINYMEHFIPDEQQRTYLLQLLRTKLTTFGYSPVVPYIIGIPGSGKGILMTILAKIMGDQYVSKEVSGGLFISSFNKGWLENKYFINLNELAEGLQNKSERTKAIGDLKLYTGSEQFQCHGKGKDPYTAPQKAMFIMTANHNPLAVEDNDRRVYYISTPNTFDTSPQCVASKSSRDIYYAITTQIEDIAYWLATEVENLNDNHYTTAPHHAGRNSIIFESLPIAEKLVWALKKKEFKLVEDYLLEPSVLFEHAVEDKVFLDNLEEAYNQLGNVEDIDKILKSLMKRYGFKQNTSNGRVYWIIPDIGYHGDYASRIESDPEAEEIRT